MILNPSLYLQSRQCGNFDGSLDDIDCDIEEVGHALTLLPLPPGGVDAAQ